MAAETSLYRSCCDEVLVHAACAAQKGPRGRQCIGSLPLGCPLSATVRLSCCQPPRKESAMASTTQRRPIPGSERTALPGAHIVGAADPQERLMVTVLVRRRPASPGLTAMLEARSARLPGQRQHMRHEEFAAAHGADPYDLDKIEAFAHEHDLDIVAVNTAQRRIVISGTVASLSAAFGVSLARYEHPGGTYRGRTGPVHVPAELAPLIQGIFGLDNRPQARPPLCLLQAQEGAPQPRAGSLSYTPLQGA